VEVRAELVGAVWKVCASVGQSVREGETIMILESMKMEIPAVSPIGGMIVEIRSAEGEVVQEGQVLAIVE
jgi:acetyl-CoA carboxylase biotin carboxyl carrier protein